MSDNGMATLRCGVEDHGDMGRLFEDHRPLTAAFSLWICQRCGTMAVHLEVPGDIYWYNAQAKSRSDDLGRHRAGCAYCSTKFDCDCNTPGQRHMCPRCDDAAEASKRTGAPLHYNREGYLASGKIEDESTPLPPQFPPGANPGERADEARQQKTYEAAVDAWDRRRGHA